MKYTSRHLVAAAVAAASITLAARADDTPQPFGDFLQPINLMLAPDAPAQSPGSASTTDTPAPSPSPQKVHTWELPPVKVVGERQSDLREEDRVGSYEQPRWTADRRFPGTRTYVIPENKIEFEFWTKPEIPQHGGGVAWENLYELEIGLPHRFQLDLYFIQDFTGNGGKQFLGRSIEVRYALADWGKIWGNPTFYIEYSNFDHDPDTVEGKLLLTGELAPRWHWGVNLSCEVQVAGERTREYEFTGGVSYTVIDEKFSIGGEIEAGWTDAKDRRGKFENEVKIGPSMQWRPIPQMHVDFAPLLGVTDHSPTAKIYLVIGYEF